MLILLIGLVVAFLIAPRNVEPSFAVSAATEQGEFRILPGNQPRWWLAGVSLSAEGVAMNVGEKPFTGSIVPAVGSTIAVRRIAQGPLLLTIDAGERSSGELFDPSGRRIARLGPSTTVRWDSVVSRAARGVTVTLSLDDGVGLENLGENATFRAAPTPLLRSGRISLLKRSFKVLGGEVQEVGSEPLELGDQVTFASRASATGFLTVDERPALSASIRVVTPKAWITPSGGVRRDVSATLFDSIKNDKAVQRTLAIFGAVFVILKALQSDEEKRKSERQQKRHG